MTRIAQDFPCGRTAAAARSWRALGVAAGLAPCLILVAGCFSYAYTPDARTPPTLAPQEAMTALQGALEQGTGPLMKPLRNVTVTREGFSYTTDEEDFLSTETLTHHFLYRDLPDLAVEGGRMSTANVRLGTGDLSIRWRRSAPARQFVDAVRAMRDHALHERVMDDGAALADFERRAATWRSLPHPPALPEDARRFKVLAEDAFHNHDLAQAVAYYERGLALCPLWPDGQFNAALLCADLGMYGRAVHHMQRYLALRPEAPDARSARDRMYIWDAKAGRN